jgi:hypothetical protein
MTKISDKDRVLRFLQKGSVACETAADASKLILHAGERGRIAISRTVVMAMVRDGDLCSASGRLALTGDRKCDGLGAAPREIVAVVAGGSSSATAIINANESPLAQLYRRRGSIAPFLDEVEFRAGERLRSDYERACIMPRLGVNWETAVSAGRRSALGGSLTELADAVLAARQRVDRAIRDVGPELAGVLIDVCCFLKGMETVEAERRWPARSAKLLLKAALGALARHYQPPQKPRHSVLHWGADGYRPSIAG